LFYTWNDKSGQDGAGVRDLNDLRFFAAVVSSGGFSSAARELGLPKSRLSRRIAQLEADLGVRLLERSTRRLTVTDVGREVYAQALTATAAAEAATEAAMRVRAEPQGLVRLSCPLNLHDSIARRLPALLTDHPRLRLQILSTNRRVDLIEERVDIAVRVRERLDTDGELQMRRIGVSRRIVVASPAFVRDHGLPDAPRDLAGLPLVDSNEGPGRSIWRLSAGEDSHDQVEFDARLAAGDLKTLLAAALAGVGAALLPAVDCRPHLEAERLVRLLPAWGAADGVLHLVFISRRSMLPSVRAVIDFAAEALVEAVQ
jgi:DNA-binding transcriptional LysR family regulator